MVPPITEQSPIERKANVAIGAIVVVAFVVAPTRGGLIGSSAAAATMLGCGLAARFQRQRIAATAIGLLAAFIFLSDGYYWNVFKRGHGLFTDNRLSAAAFYFALLFAPALIAKATR